jgi:hypothetical protein
MGLFCADKRRYLPRSTLSEQREKTTTSRGFSKRQMKRLGVRMGKLEKESLMAIKAVQFLKKLLKLTII